MANSMRTQLPLFEAPRPAVDTNVHLQLRRRGRRQDVMKTFDTQAACAAFLTGSSYDADEALVTQRDENGSMALFFGGYIDDVRQWAKEAGRE